MAARQERARNDQVRAPLNTNVHPLYGTDVGVRSNILRSPRRLREIISAPEFVRYFGEPKPNARDGRSSIFGREDELKNAPKGIAKDHPCVHAH